VRERDNPSTLQLSCRIFNQDVGVCFVAFVEPGFFGEGGVVGVFVVKSREPDGAPLISGGKSKRASWSSTYPFKLSENRHW
jgi:hypothetical protein